jgi:ribonuclease P/MRP protein subunit POP5
VKHLPKHLRPKRRYLAVELDTWPDVRLSRGEFQRSLWYAAQNLLGDPGSARADCTVVRFDGEDGRAEAVVRARHGEVAGARAAVACLERVDGEPVRPTVRGVSGTIRACEEKYLGRPAEAPTEATVVFEGTDRPAVCRSAVADVRVDGAHVGATAFDCE